MDSLKLQSLASRPARIRSACRTGLPSFHSDLAVKGRGQAKASNVNDVIHDPVVDKPIACVKPAVAEKAAPFCSYRIHVRKKEGAGNFSRISSGFRSGSSSNNFQAVRVQTTRCFTVSFSSRFLRGTF